MDAKKRKHFVTYWHVCSSFIVFSMQLKYKKKSFFPLLVYTVILCIFWITLSCKHMWGSVQMIWMILAFVNYQHFIYHTTWASCSEILFFKTWWDNFLKSIKWLSWQFPDLRVQPGSHCGRPLWHYKMLKNFSKKSQNTMLDCW